MDSIHPVYLHYASFYKQLEVLYEPTLTTGTRPYKKAPLTKKQAKNRVKSKAQRKSRKANR